ncbi:ATP-binding protein [Glaciihabitans arcticus]|uniref:ATP-binding protein n=1 Tax=Glaciihabitans arcticus TaxID=2668039 RepID=A0A4Q9H065_9MICO|nr:ATP/GTP-binding protein [Glaciihabitans arcticus]TBN58080.1 ATP-binding protein [Glaciihabitans arcticus]
MAEHVILFSGPMGAGKTTAIQTLSEIEMVSTEASNTERHIVDKATTTVALDYGEITLGLDEKVRLYGVPGQKRFDFMWTILKERARGMILLVGNDAPDPVAVALEYLESFRELVESGSAVVGVSRRDIVRAPNTDAYADAISAAYPGTMIPVFSVDPRNKAQMTTVLLTLVATLESRSVPEEVQS